MQSIKTSAGDEARPANGAAPPENNESATTQGQDPIESLQEVLEQLEKQLKDLETQIGEAKDDIKTAEDEHSQLEGHKKELTARKTALENLLKGAEAGQAQIKQARQEASQASEEAWNDHQQITEDLADQLNPEYQEMLTQAIETVDTHISGLKERQKQINKKISDAEVQLEAVKKEALKAKNDLSAAEQALRGLPRLIQSVVTQVKQLQKAMKDDFKKGCPKDSFLNAADLKTALEALARYISTEYEQELKAEINSAWQAIKEISAQESELSETLKQHQNNLSSIEAELKDYTDTRRQKIKDELEKAENDQDEEDENDQDEGGENDQNEQGETAQKEETKSTADTKDS